MVHSQAIRWVLSIMISRPAAGDNADRTERIKYQWSYTHFFFRQRCIVNEQIFTLHIHKFVFFSRLIENSVRQVYRIIFIFFFEESWLTDGDRRLTKLTYKKYRCHTICRGFSLSYTWF